MDLQHDTAKLRLKAEVVEAQAAFDVASVHRRELRHLAASGIRSNGIITLREAEELYAASRRLYATALRRLSDFVVAGRLQDSAATAERPITRSESISREEASV